MEHVPQVLATLCTAGRTTGYGRPSIQLPAVGLMMQLLTWRDVLAAAAPDTLTGLLRAFVEAPVLSGGDETGLLLNAEAAQAATSTAAQGTSEAAVTQSASKRQRLALRKLASGPAALSSSLAGGGDGSGASSPRAPVAGNLPSLIWELVAVLQKRTKKEGTVNMAAAVQEMSCKAAEMLILLSECVRSAGPGGSEADAEWAQPEANRVLLTEVRAVHYQSSINTCVA